jgi:hypothetical protein
MLVQIAILAWIFLGEPISAREGAGLILAVLGSREGLHEAGVEHELEIGSSVDQHGGNQTIPGIDSTDDDIEGSQVCGSCGIVPYRHSDYGRLGFTGCRRRHARLRGYRPGYPVGVPSPVEKSVGEPRMLYMLGGAG